MPHFWFGFFTGRNVQIGMDFETAVINNYNVDTKVSWFGNLSASYHESDEERYLLFGKTSYQEQHCKINKCANQYLYNH